MHVAVKESEDPLVTFGNSIFTKFVNCIMNFIVHFQVIIFARRLSSIIGNMGNMDASEALLVELLPTLNLYLLIIQQKIIFTLGFEIIRF